jgi:hypothetical protein
VAQVSLNLVYPNATSSSIIVANPSITPIVGTSEMVSALFFAPE